jgi:hypothetical protein
MNRVPPTTVADSRRDHPAAGKLDRTLALGWRLLTAARALAGDVALSDLGDIDLPGAVGTPADQGRLHAVPPLYLAADLEEAHLVPAVETMAALFAGGGLNADLGPSASRLVAFWQERHARLAATERQAILAQLFGMTTGPSLANAPAQNTDFESCMIDLTEAIYKLDQALGAADLAQQYKVSAAAEQLAGNLLAHTGGMALAAAHDLLATIQEAVDILKAREIQQAVGANSIWGAVRAITQSYLGQSVDIASHVTRGKAGMLVLAWLADVGPHLGTGAEQLVSAGHPVIGAAGSWLKASLTLHQEDAPAAQRGVR